MLDHALGRPSAGLKRVQVLVITLLCYHVLKIKPNSNGAPRSTNKLAIFMYWFNKRLANSPPWKVVFGTLSAAWFMKNVLLLLGGNAPEPLARMYTRSFYRGTYFLTGLDAGFFTVMHIKPKWLRDILSIVCTVFYLVFPDTADEKVRKFRAHPTIDMMRTSWEKSQNPYLKLASARDRPNIKIRKDITIPRPDPPSISSFPNVQLGPVSARIYYNGTADGLSRAKELVFLLPGGGFVAMGPKCHEDHVSQWAKITKVPIISLDYGKAPEFPYPWALEECFDAYRSVVESNGAVLGMSGWFETKLDGVRVRKAPIKIVMVGDSAGGNLAVGVVMRCLETYEKHIRPPNGLVLIYPCLSFDMSCWMPSEQLKLMRAESHKNLSLKSFANSKSTMKKNSPLTPQDAPRRIDVINDKVDHSASWYTFMKPKSAMAERRQGPSIPSSLSMTSRMSYFTDRIITPEMMRAMALLYLGTSPIPIDLASDYYLSPVMAPDDLLARFPKTYMLCGEKDPFVDDTVVFAGRLRENKLKARKEWERMMAKAEAGNVLAGLNGKTGVSHVNGNKPNGIVNGKSNATSSVPRPQRHTSGLQMGRDVASSRSVSKKIEIVEPAEPIRTHIFSREPDTMVRVKILEGVSHAFFQMLSLIPEAKQACRLTADWFTEMMADPGVDDHGDDLTEFMINDMHAIEGECSGPQVGPYYPAYGVPKNAPCPHIDIAAGSHANINGHPSNGSQVRFHDGHDAEGNSETDPEYSPDLVSSSVSASINNLASPTSDDATSPDSELLSPAPIMDEVDEKKILERRRVELGSMLYTNVQDG